MLLKYYAQKVQGEWFKLSFQQIQEVKRYIDSIEVKQDILFCEKKSKEQSSQLLLFDVS